MRPSIATALVASVFAGAVIAKLPPLNDEAKAKAAETANKAAWTDKVGAYQLCQSMNKVASAYRSSATAAAKAASGADPTPACVDPGPYVAQVTPAASKPLEAAGAHSPPGMATSPPSNKATSAEMTGPRK